MRVRTRKKPARAETVRPPEDLWELDPWHHAAQRIEAEREEEGRLPLAVQKKVREARAFKARCCREDVNEFAVYVGRDAETGARIRQHRTHERFQELADEHPRLIIMSHPESGKALPLDTPIPTPDGWRTMGELDVGDEVFGRDGRPTRVIWCSPIQHQREVFELEWDDGSRLLADADHRWLAKNRDDRASGRAWREVTTREMLERVTRDRDGQRANWSMPLPEPVEYAEAELPIHPYVLGAWLGDGDAQSPTLTFHADDRAVFDRARELAGGDCEPTEDRPGVLRGSLGYRSKRRAREPGRVRAALRELGVLGDKHIPERYLLASVAQRMELLRGLLDTDGWAQRDRPAVAFSASNERLRDGVLQLVRSLGFKASVRTKETTHADSYTVEFTARGAHVFHLSRKQAVLDAAGEGSEPSGRAASRYVRAIRPVESVPVRCIAVDAPDHAYLAGRDYLVTHNTQQIGVLRALWLLGNNPNLRIAVVSKTGGTSAKVSRACRSYIEKSQELAEVFPHLVPGSKWEETFWTVQRSVTSTDPSFQALGLHGTVIGSRIDVLIFDDSMDDENTMTPAERKKTLRRIRVFLERLSSNAVVVMLTNAWHPEDAAHILQLEGWHREDFPVEDEEGNPTWPDKWDLPRIAKARQDSGPLEFARAYLCRARDEGENPFDKDAIEAATQRARDLGLELVPVIDRSTPGWELLPIFTGVDLAVTKTSGSHLTALVTLLVWPEDFSRQVLWVESGRWSSREIRDRILDTERRYQPTAFIVENNAAQRWMIDIIANQADLPEEDRVQPTVIPFRTGRQKAHSHYGVEGLAVEIAAGLWLFPDRGPQKAVEEVQELKQGMLYYSRGAHTADRLMAGWFAREGARRGARAGDPMAPEEKRDLDHLGGGGGGVRVFDGGDGVQLPGMETLFPG